jgi:proline dehydrogenase
MSLIRSALLAASESRFLRERATKLSVVRTAVRRFMPGEDAESALDASRALGVGTVLTRLGENLASAKEAEEVTRHYLGVLDRVHAARLDVEISVKPTQLGLDFSKEDCERHLHILLARAKAQNNWVWIDMESTAYTEVTLEIYRRARERFPNTGLCVQSYLYRTAADVELLITLGAGVRLVKGAYKEPPDKAFPKKRDVDESFFKLATKLLSTEARAKKVRAIFGTHDPVLIRRIEDHGRAEKLPPEALEFQMLYGIRKNEQERIAKAGYKFRVLISYGDAWWAWYMRRLAERPANLLFVVKTMFAR